MKTNSSFDAIGDVLRRRERFVVMSHMRPDGDALGCSIAMGLCLQQMGKDVTIWNQDGVPEKFRFMPNSELVKVPPAAPENFDVLISLDTAVRNRAGSALEAVSKFETHINIDHHISNDHYGDLAYIDSTAPACGEVLYELFKQQNLPLTYPMADNLFVAISTDTGSYQYPSTTARTYEIAAELIKLGVNVGDLSQKMYESYPRRRLELLREVLKLLRFSSNDRVASFALPMATVKALGVEPVDNEGLIDHLRAVQGVIVAAFFEELPEGRTRISLRSKDPRADVCAVCQQFGGGGHVLAAGARVAGSLPEVEERVLKAIDAVVSGL